MYILKKNNVERMTSDENMKKSLVSKGFTVVKNTDEEEINENSGDEEKDVVLEKMSLDELKAYADERGIDIGKSSSQTGIIEKIKAAISE